MITSTTVIRILSSLLEMYGAEIGHFRISTGSSSGGVFCCYVREGMTFNLEVTVERRSTTPITYQSLDQALDKRPWRIVVFLSVDEARPLDGNFDNPELGIHYMLTRALSVRHLGAR